MKRSISVNEVAVSQQAFYQKINHCFSGACRVVPTEHVVYFIGEDYLVELDFLAAQSFDQIGGLLERDVAIVVVAMDEQANQSVSGLFRYLCCEQSIAVLLH